MIMIEAGLISAIGLFFILCRFNMRRICGYATLVDIICTIGFCVIFLGTYAGMMTGIFAGVCVSVVLNLMRALWGYEKARLIRRSGALLPSLVWVRTPGRLS
jgi:hypothetical protein